MTIDTQHDPKIGKGPEIYGPPIHDEAGKPLGPMSLKEAQAKIVEQADRIEKLLASQDRTEEHHRKRLSEWLTIAAFIAVGTGTAGPIGAWLGGAGIGFLAYMAWKGDLPGLRR